MKRIYFDTGTLVKLYVVEQGSELVQQRAAKAGEIPLNPLQTTELKNAILAAVGRKIISQEAAEKTLENFENDIDEGYYVPESPDWIPVWQRASNFARQYTPNILCRTLDILHVALAEYAGIDEFVTGDKRQAALAEQIGLNLYRID